MRSFLAVVDEGSLTGAARALNLSQPTLGRHIKAVEDAVGEPLFKRTARGFDPTEAGRKLARPARDMAAASREFETMAVGRDARLSGTVRLTASVVVSNYILPAIIADLRRTEPEVEIELVPSDTSENLIFREADIAVRMYRPTQLDVVTRKITQQPLALYGAHELLDRRGTPQTLDDLAHYPFVGFDRSKLIVDHMRDAGLHVDRHFFGVRCDDQATFWQLVRAGCGLGAMQTAIGDVDPLVRKVDLDLNLPPLPIWLTAHEALHKNVRIKRVWDHLAAALAKI
ncbi:MAG: LysR family transcriptional regulator [Pseudomonadota bacterium]